MARETVHVRGYRELLKANAQAPLELRRRNRETFRAVGELVRSEAAVRFASIDERSAAGYRTRVRQRGIIVEQSLRKTTGKHPEYGRLQMRRALLPAAAANEDETVRRLERALDEVCDRWETSYPIGR